MFAFVVIRQVHEEQLVKPAVAAFPRGQIGDRVTVATTNTAVCGPPSREKVPMIATLWRRCCRRPAHPASFCPATGRRGQWPPSAAARPHPLGTASIPGADWRRPAVRAESSEAGRELRPLNPGATLLGDGGIPRVGLLSEGFGPLPEPFLEDLQSPHLTPPRDRRIPAGRSPARDAALGD